jgi:hypothetical protein
MKTGELLAVTGEIVDSLQSTVMLYLIESSLPDLKAYAELKHGESCSLSISSWRPKGGGLQQSHFLGASGDGSAVPGNSVFQRPSSVPPDVCCFACS